MTVVREGGGNQVDMLSWKPREMVKLRDYSGTQILDL